LLKNMVFELYMFDQIELCGQHNDVASHGTEAPDYRNQPLGLPGLAWTGQGMTVTKDTRILTTLSRASWIR